MPESPPPDPESKPTPSSEPPSRSFLAELKRRKVFRVAVTYAVVAWLIIQVAAATFSGFGIPDWAFRFVVIMLLLGFPVALIITWAFELTPDGIKLTRNVSEQEKQHTAQGKRNGVAFAFAAGLPTLIFGALAAYFYLQKPQSPVIEKPEPPRFEVNAKSIAVLPFANMSEDAQASSFFADGVHEDLLTNLSYVRDLSVVSRTSVMAYRDTTKPVKQIADELGVVTLLEGSVRRSGNRVRVTAQLIDAKSDEHIWAQSYDRNLEDIFAIQSELAKSIASALQVALSDDETGSLEKRPTDNLAAYELLLRHRELESSGENTPERVDEGIDLLTEAVAIDPRFAIAWGELAKLHAQSYFWYYDHSQERLSKASEAIKRALELDPKDLDVIALSGDVRYYANRDYQGAAAAYQRVLEAAPNHVGALGSMGFIRRREGKWAESISWHNRALEIDPRNLVILSGLRSTYQSLRNFDEGAATAKRIFEIDRSNLFNEFLLSAFESARINDFEPLEAFVGRYQESDQNSIAPLRRAHLFLAAEKRDWERCAFLQAFNVAEEDDPVAKAEEMIRLALYHRKTGDSDKSASILSEAEAIITALLDEQPENLVGLFDICRIYIHQGKSDESWSIIERLESNRLILNDALDATRQWELEIIYLANFNKPLEAVGRMREFLKRPVSQFGSPVFLKTEIDMAPLFDHPDFLALVQDKDAWKAIKPAR